MIGIVLITHGGLGNALRDAMEHVVGTQRQVGTVSIGPDDDIQSMRSEIARAIEATDTGDGVALLTDMFGSTPSNLAVSMLDRGGIEVISGVNLPMLVKLAKARAAGTLCECADFAEAAGRKYISTASHLPAACLGGSSCVGRLAEAEPRESKPALAAGGPER